MSLSLTEVLAWLCWVGFLVKIDISVCFERLGFVCCLSVDLFFGFGG